MHYWLFVPIECRNVMCLPRINLLDQLVGSADQPNKIKWAAYEFMIFTLIALDKCLSTILLAYLRTFERFTTKYIIRNSMNSIIGFIGFIVFTVVLHCWQFCELVSKNIQIRYDRLVVTTFYITFK